MKENLAKVIVLTIDAMCLVVRCEFHLNITTLLNLEYLHSIIMLILFELVGMLVHLEVKWFLHLVKMCKRLNKWIQRDAIKIFLFNKMQDILVGINKCFSNSIHHPSSISWIVSI